MVHPNAPGQPYTGDYLIEGYPVGYRPPGGCPSEIIRLEGYLIGGYSMGDQPRQAIHQRSSRRRLSDGKLYIVSFLREAAPRKSLREEPVPLVFIALNFIFLEAIPQVTPRVWTSEWVGKAADHGWMDILIFAQI